MKPKPKKCKGTGKAIGNGCGEMATFRKYGLCNDCLKVWYLTTEAGKEQLTKISLKVTEPRRSLEKATKAAKERKGITTHLNTTKEVVHSYVRKRDEGKSCISCGVPWKSDFQAGHCWNANNYRSIKFDLRNINGQCRKCNLMLDGNEEAYLLRLPGRIGQEAFDDLKKLAALDKRNVKKWTREELKQIRNEVKQLTKQL